jgi:hypothetical protein
MKRKRNEKSSEMKCSEGFDIVLVAMKASKASKLTSSLIEVTQKDGIVFRLCRYERGAAKLLLVFFSPVNPYERAARVVVTRSMITADRVQNLIR